jgi:hypothetical protein
MQKMACRNNIQSLVNGGQTVGLTSCARLSVVNKAQLYGLPQLPLLTFKPVDNFRHARTKGDKYGSEQDFCPNA